jgi:putative endonuclease
MRYQSIRICAVAVKAWQQAPNQTSLKKSRSSAVRSLVISSEVEKSLNISAVARDYDFWVYIMTNQHESVLYLGMTNSLSRRASQHERGEIAGFTLTYRCKKLVYYEHYRHVQDAIARETQLKKWSRAKKVALINVMNPRWLDLSKEILEQ